MDWSVQKGRKHPSFSKLTCMIKKKTDTAWQIPIREHTNNGSEWWDTLGPLSMGPVLSDICRKFSPPQVNLQQAKTFPQVLGNVWICYFFTFPISLFLFSWRASTGSQWKIRTQSSESWRFLAGSLEAKYRHHCHHSHWVLICPLQGLCAPQSVSLTFSSKWSVFPESD